MINLREKVGKNLKMFILIRPNLDDNTLRKTYNASLIINFVSRLFEFSSFVDL